MARIQKLTKQVANQISAGEVIERPASVVKELVENSVDAGADKIEISISRGGKEFVRVRDNGQGIASSEIELAFSRYATSKISSIDDIYSLTTLGFRGEALASIAAVSRMEIKSRQAAENSGVRLEIEGGEVISRERAGLPAGTEITVRDLFFNTPARYKYLKKTSTEASRISRLITSLALARPEINFTLENQRGEVLSTPGSGNLEDNIFSLYGEEVYDNLITLNFSREFLQVSGYLINPRQHRSSRQHEYFFVNGRPVKNRFLRMAVEEAYGTRLPAGKYPLVFLNINLNPILVDVNIHPTKKEVKFSRGESVKDILQQEITQKLKKSTGYQEFSEAETGNYSGRDDHSARKDTFSQEKDRARDRTQNKDKGSAGNDRQQHLFSGRDLDRQQIEAVSYQSSDTPSNSESALFKESGTSQESNQESPPKSDSSLPGDYQVLGQLHNLFILLETGDGLLLVDQHNAHERIIYDNLCREIEGKSNDSRLLLTPLPLDLSPQEKEIILDIKPELKEMGFSIEEFGPSSLMLSAVPVFLEEESGRENLLDIINQILEKARIIDKHELNEEILIYSACRQAVKEGVSLSMAEMRRISAELFQTSNPYRCPHHRPIVIRLSLDQLKKKVDR